MPSGRAQHEVVSVSLPRDLVKRANALIPKTRRSRVITSMLTAFLDSVERKKLAREAWAILEKEETRGRRKAG
jgi:metal-responsive CopG/Arc/MetJ family transcriptional regulator